MVGECFGKYSACTSDFSYFLFYPQGHEALPLSLQGRLDSLYVDISVLQDALCIEESLLGFSFGDIEFLHYLVEFLVTSLVP